MLKNTWKKIVSQRFALHSQSIRKATPTERYQSLQSIPSALFSTSKAPAPNSKPSKPTKGKSSDPIPKTEKFNTVELLKDDESEFLDSVVLSSKISPHIQVSKTGTWVDTFKHDSLMLLDLSTDEWTHGPYVTNTTPNESLSSAVELIVKLLPVNENIKEHIIKSQTLYTFVEKNNDPALLKYIPIRDRLVLAINRINPRVLLFFNEFYHFAFSNLVPYATIRNIPNDQAIYLQFLSRFFGCSTKTEDVDDKTGLCTVVIFRPIQKVNHHIPVIHQNPEIVDKVSNFVNGNKRFIDSVTAVHQIDLQNLSTSQYMIDAKDTTKKENYLKSDDVDITKLRNDISTTEGFIPSGDFSVKICTPSNTKVPEYPTINPHPNRSTSLPAFEGKDLFLHAMSTNQVLMVIGPTGSGKSTQFPQFVMDWMAKQGKIGQCRIMMTQPRRLAAISLAHRVSSEQGHEIMRAHTTTEGGNRAAQNALNMPVGYAVRYEHYYNDFTNLTFVTSGLLLRRLTSRDMIMTPNDIMEQSRLNPSQESYWTSSSSVLIQRVCRTLSQYTHIFIDEVHESNTDTDLLLAILRDALPFLPHLRVILMSATANTQSLCEYMRCKTVVEISARTFPIDVYNSYDVAKMISSVKPTSVESKYDTFMKYLALCYDKGIYDDKFLIDISEETINRATYLLSYEPSTLEIAEQISPTAPEDVINKHVVDLIKFISRNSVSQKVLESNKSRFSVKYSNNTVHSDQDNKASNNTIAGGGESAIVHTGEEFNNLVKSFNADTQFSEQGLQFAKIFLQHMNSQLSHKYPNKKIDHTDSSVPKYISHVANESFKLESPGVSVEQLPHGSILIFAPSLARIKALQSLILADPVLSNKDRFNLHLLHSSISNVVQMQVFDSVPEGVTKIVLGTNIAETSLTIPDASHIIDLGQAKTVVYDAVNDTNNFTLEIAAKSNANQRKGRAGRTCPGVCYRFYSKELYDQMVPQPRPELFSRSIDSTVMTIKKLCYPPPQLAKLRKDGFDEVVYFMKRLINGVSDFNLSCSFRRLSNSQILDHQGRLTLLGYYTSNLPLDPAIGRIVILSILNGCYDAGLTIAAFLSSNQYLMKDKSGKIYSQYEELVSECKNEYSTALLTYNAWCMAPNRHQFCIDHGVSYAVMDSWTRLRIQIFMMLKKTDLADLIGPLAITKGGRMIYHQPDEQLLTVVPSQSDIEILLNKFHQDSSIFDVHNADDAHEVQVNLSGLDADGVLLKSTVDKSVVDVKPVIPDIMNLNDFPIESQEWKPMLNNSRFHTGSKSVSSIFNSTTQMEDLEVTQLQETTRQLKTVFEVNSTGKNFYNELYESFGVGDTIQIGPTAPSLEEMKKILSLKKTLPIPHANYAACIPGLIDLVISSSLYPQIGISRGMMAEETQMKSATITCPPPSNKKVKVDVFGKEIAPFQSPFIAYSSPLKLSSGFTIRNFKDASLYSLLLTPFTMNGMTLQENANSVIDSAHHMYNSDKYSQITNVMEYETENPSYGIKHDALVHNAFTELFPDNEAVMTTPIPSFIENHPHQVAPVTSQNHESVLADLLWDASYTTEDQRREHIEKYGFHANSTQLTDLFSTFISGYVGIHEKLPSTHIVLNYMVNVLNGYQLLSDTQEDNFTDNNLTNLPSRDLKKVPVASFHNSTHFTSLLDIKLNKATNAFVINNPLVVSSSSLHSPLLRLTRSDYSPLISIIDSHPNPNPLYDVFKTHFQHMSSDFSNLFEGSQSFFANKTGGKRRDYILNLLSEILLYKVQSDANFRRMCMLSESPSIQFDYNELFKNQILNKSVTASTFDNLTSRLLSTSIPGNVHIPKLQNQVFVDSIVSNEIHNEISNALAGQGVITDGSSQGYLASVSDACDSVRKIPNSLQVSPYNYILSNFDSNILLDTRKMNRLYHQSLIYNYINSHPIYHDAEGRDLDLSHRLTMIDHWLGFYINKDLIQAYHSLRVVTNSVAFNLLSNKENIKNKFFLYHVLQFLSKMSIEENNSKKLLNPKSRLDNTFVSKPQVLLNEIADLSEESEFDKTKYNFYLMGELQKMINVPLVNTTEVDFLSDKLESEEVVTFNNIYSYPALDKDLQYK